MRHHAIKAIVSLVMCFFITTVMLFGVIYISGSRPGMDSMFIPATVKQSLESEDIIVRVYPISVVPHSPGEDEVRELKLNQIDRGWVTNMYNGNCRLVFERRDSYLINVIKEDGLNYYYYAEIIPQQRISVDGFFWFFTFFVGLA